MLRPPQGADLSGGLVTRRPYAPEDGAFTSSENLRRRAGFRVAVAGALGLAFKYDSTAVSVESQKPTVPDQFELSQNYPNPFNPSTTISFAIPENSNVKLSVYNLLGEEITTLLNGDLSAGYHSVDWNSLKNGKLISSGIYFYSINATGASGNKFISAKKMILLK